MTDIDWGTIENWDRRYYLHNTTSGRELNYAECHEVKLIVDANKKNGNGFRDLMLALITSKTFGTK